jgi:hypothetical protein
MSAMPGTGLVADAATGAFTSAKTLFHIQSLLPAVLLHEQRPYTRRHNNVLESLGSEMSVPGFNVRLS